MDETHSQLLEQAAGGDATALRTLLERFGPQVRASIVGEIGKQWQSVLDADDVMQVTYLEAFLQINRMNARDPAGFAAWLGRIAQNNLRDAIKELQRKKRPQPKDRVVAPAGEESYVALLETLGTASSTPSRHVARLEAGHILDGALGRLPIDYRTVVRLYDLEGRPPAEIAETMGRSVGAVHMLRARAHDRLRSTLGSSADFFSDMA